MIIVSVTNDKTDGNTEVFDRSSGKNIKKKEGK
jgi:hypothetical protein